MEKTTLDHSFYIPVMGTSFTIDTPIKVAKYGISSVISIGDDELCETMKRHYAKGYQLPYQEIEKLEPDYRAKRITSYLNLVNDIVNLQIETMKSLSFEADNDLVKYFTLLPETSALKALYLNMKSETDPLTKERLQNELKNHVKPGSIDVNIMTKIDRSNYDAEGNLLPDEYSDALSALRGYALSELKSGIVFSAGFNRRLYSYIEKFKDFFPDAMGNLKKKVIMKVSDYRSSLTQGKFLAKKGIWISEHRIESGLNCGGHAFASEGYLLGPILEEFKLKKQEILSTLKQLCNEALSKKGAPIFKEDPELLITVQGGIGTTKENQFLFDHYKVDRTGWATPFLLVPEATTVDLETRKLLAQAKKEDLYLSGISPLGVPFNAVRGTKGEKQKLDRIASGRPGSPCPKAHLVSNTEFTLKPICTASVLYQRRKLEEIRAKEMSESEREGQIEKVVAKACLCEDLAAGALLESHEENGRPLAPTVCPGPNLAHFSKIVSLAEMVGHIYGRTNVLNETYRPNMFMAELEMYIKYIKREIEDALPHPDERQLTHLKNFQQNLVEGMAYYKELVPQLITESKEYRDTMLTELEGFKKELEGIISHYSLIFSV